MFVFRTDVPPLLGILWVDLGGVDIILNATAQGSKISWAYVEMRKMRRISAPYISLQGYVPTFNVGDS